MALTTEISTTQELDTGTLVAGRFLVERMIAKGGMGAVYLAHQQGLNRKVALKTLKPLLSVEDRDEFAQRFQREAASLGALDGHQHIVRVFDYGESAPGEYYLAMEYIDGPRFNDLLKKGRIAPRRAVDLTIGVCDALYFAHNQGVVHRDIKLSNVLIHCDHNGKEQAKVVDFGLVKLADTAQDLTRAGMVMGSPHFMSPEQIQEDPIDHRTDIYSVGILLYSALTGKYPFHGDNKAAVIAAHLTKTAPPMTELCPGLVIPEKLEHIVQRCLQRDPNKRWPDMAALRDALEGVLPQLEDDSPPAVLSPDDTLRLDTVASVAAAREDTATAVWRPVAVVFGIAAALGVGILVALAAGAFWYMQSAGQPPSTPNVGVTDPQPIPEADPVVEAPPTPVEDDFIDMKLPDDPSGETTRPETTKPAPAPAEGASVAPSAPSPAAPTDTTDAREEGANEPDSPPAAEAEPEPAALPTDADAAPKETADGAAEPEDPTTDPTTDEPIQTRSDIIDPFAD